jgi:hypothetical protein
MDKGDLADRAAHLEADHMARLHEKAADKHVRAIELIWSSLVRKYHSYTPPLLTAQERGHCRALVSSYGAEALLDYLTSAIRDWKSIQAKFAALPLTPTFQSFFRYHRDLTIIIEARRHAQEREAQKRAADEAEEERLRSFQPKEGLVALYLKARKGINAGREATHAQTETGNAESKPVPATPPTSSD